MQMEFKIIATNQAEVERLSHIVAIIAIGGAVGGKEKGEFAKAAHTIEVEARKALKSAAKTKAPVAAEEDDEVAGDAEIFEDIDAEAPAEEDDGDSPRTTAMKERKTYAKVAAPLETKKAKAAAADDEDDDIPVKRGRGRPPKAATAIPADAPVGGKKAKAAAAVEDDEEIEVPEKTAPAPKGKISLSEVQDAFKARAKRGSDGRTFCFSLLEKYGAKNARDLQPKDYAAVLKALA